MSRDTLSEAPKRSRKSDPPKLDSWFLKAVLATLPAIAAGLIAWGALNAQIGDLSSDVHDAKVERVSTEERVRQLEIEQSSSHAEARATSRAIRSIETQLVEQTKTINEIRDRLPGRRR